MSMHPRMERDGDELVGPVRVLLQGDEIFIPASAVFPCGRIVILKPRGNIVADADDSPFLGLLGAGGRKPPNAAQNDGRRKAETLHSLFEVSGMAM